MPTLIKTPFNLVYLEVMYNGKKIFLYHFHFTRDAFNVNKDIFLVGFIRKMSFLMWKMLSLL